MKTKVIVRVTGLIARTIMESSRRAIHEDPRHLPFERDDECGTTFVMMSKWQGSQQFFHICRTLYETAPRTMHWKFGHFVNNVDEYVYFVNAWLTIVNYFGLKVRYRQEFVQQMREIATMIPLYAFRRKGEVVDNKVCHFHHHDYTRKEMEVMFENFFKDYDVTG